MDNATDGLPKPEVLTAEEIERVGHSTRHGWANRIDETPYAALEVGCGVVFAQLSSDYRRRRSQQTMATQRARKLSIRLSPLAFRTRTLADDRVVIIRTK